MAILLAPIWILKILLIINLSIIYFLRPQNLTQRHIIYFLNIFCVIIILIRIWWWLWFRIFAIYTLCILFFIVNFLVITYHICSIYIGLGHVYLLILYYYISIRVILNVQYVFIKFITLSSIIFIFKNSINRMSSLLNFRISSWFLTK
jgi:hypothetical protein